MGLSDPGAIVAWLQARGHEGAESRHDWTLVVAASVDGEDPSVRAICRSCGLIRRKPLSSNTEMFIDLSGPCPGDSAYWREQQEDRARARKGE